YDSALRRLENNEHLSSTRGAKSRAPPRQPRRGRGSVFSLGCCAKSRAPPRQARWGPTALVAILCFGTLVARHLLVDGGEQLSGAQPRQHRIRPIRPVDVALTVNEDGRRCGGIAAVRRRVRMDHLYRVGEIVIRIGYYDKVREVLLGCRGVFKSL